ncbi:MAG: GNAT family N-acetyltransferase [Anaerolineae bacterium]
MQTRQFRWEDLPQLVDFMNRYATVNGRRATSTLEHIEKSWRAPQNHPEDDAFVSVEDGQIVGYTIADLLDDPHYAFGVYQVMPGHHEAARALMQAATERFQTVAFAKSPPDVDIALDWMIPQVNQEAITLCEMQGFPLVRQFYKMRIGLNEPIEAQPLPAGFVRRPFVASQLEAVMAAKVEAFQDHWGEQHDTIEEWQYTIDQDNFDASLWWVIYDDDQIVGTLLSYPFNERSGYVSIVGVRPAWRKRGLAQAMLTQCFATYQERGFEDVYLDVDSDSSTNALALYQRVGMRVHDCRLYYRHVLRPAATA